jgi:membrane-associated protein
METHIASIFSEHPEIIQGGYLAMFIAMLIEGPFITAFGGLAAATGIFNVWTVLIISILGNFIPDVVLYAIGRWGRRYIDKYGSHFGITNKKIKTIEALYDKHPFFVLLVSKLVPMAAPPGLVAAGAMRMPIVRYSIMSLAIILVTSGIYLATGYYAGAMYVQIVHYQIIALAVISVLIIGIVYAFNKLMAKLGRKIVPDFESKNNKNRS